MQLPRKIVSMSPVPGNHEKTPRSHQPHQTTAQSQDEENRSFSWQTVQYWRKVQVPSIPAVLVSQTEAASLHRAQGPGQPSSPFVDTERRLRPHKLVIFPGMLTGGAGLPPAIVSLAQGKKPRGDSHSSTPRHTEGQPRKTSGDEIGKREHTEQ